jgi:hypothetical protein
VAGCTGTSPQAGPERLTTSLPVAMGESDIDNDVLDAYLESRRREA